MNPRFLLLGLLICFALLSLFLLFCISSWIGLEETTISALNNGVDDKIDDDLTHSTTAAVARLKELNINFLAFDFDLTIVDIHTGGRWKGTNPAILPHVRPYFSLLLQKSLDSDIHVAIVTFSTQVDLIRSVLDYHTQRTNTSTIIPIRGGMNKKNNGKQSHMKSAIQELVERHNNLRITKETSLLIDDDVTNIETALRNGIRAIWFNPLAPSEQVLTDIANLE